jgi:hypothetical protein
MDRERERERETDASVQREGVEKEIQRHRRGKARQMEGHLRHAVYYEAGRQANCTEQTTHTNLDHTRRIDTRAGS